MAIKSFKFFWTTHKWAGIIISLILANIVVTGILLLFKKQFAWIQPAEHRGSISGELSITFDQILDAVSSVPEAEVTSWKDVNRLDVRPGRGMLKVRCNNEWEVQIDANTGEVLQVAYRRSDIIETIHDGSFFGEWAHGWVWPITAVVILFLIFSGFWLWLEPKFRKAKRKRRDAGRAVSMAKRAV